MLQYFKQEQERKETPVDEDWHPFVLKEGVHAVSITVLPEKEANEEELKRWNGIRRVFERNWAVIGSGTEVNLLKMVGERLFNIHNSTTLNDCSP